MQAVFIAFLACGCSDKATPAGEAADTAIADSAQALVDVAAADVPAAPPDVASEDVPLPPMDVSADAPATGEPTVPTEKAALLAWLNAKSYAGFAAESKIHASSGPHGSGVRTFLNAALASSFGNGGAAHPQGAAAVKELYDDKDTLLGWAVAVKVAADSDAGKGWYWFESLTLDGSSGVYADGTGVGLCTGCHKGGADFVHTPWPLQ